MENRELHVIVGSGPLGMAVMEELVSRGKRVRMVNRSGAANVPQDVEVVRGDAAIPESIQHACEGAAVIYHCAKPPYTKWPEQFPPIMNGLITAASRSGAKLVYADNLYMYGPHQGRLTEDLPYRATGPKGKTRANMALQLLEAHKNGSVRAVIGRASDFYGPGVLESALGVLVCKAALAGKPAFLMGNIDVPHTYTYIKDFAKGLVTLGEREEALGEVWHVPSAETMTTRQLVTMIYEEANHVPKFRVTSRSLATFFGLFSSSMRELKEVFHHYEHEYIVDHSKFANAFGEATTPNRQAIRETLEWYKQSM